MNNKIKKGVGFAVLAFMLCTAFTINVAAANADIETTYNPNAIKKGYHLEVLGTLSCSHTDKNQTKTVSCELTGLNQSKEEILGAVHVYNGLPVVTQFTTRPPEGIKSSSVSNLVLNVNVLGTGTYELAGNYVCKDDGYAAYAYYRYYFSYCNYTEANYFVASEHSWLGCARGDTGKKEYHPYAYSHIVTRYKFVPNKYQIAFDGNGATSGNMKNQSMTYDNSGTLHLNKYKRTGYNFNGWNTKKDGTGTAYKDTQSVKNLTEKNNEKITLYAQWNPNTLTIRYHANGGQAKSGYSLKNYIVQKNDVTVVKNINYETVSINLHNVSALMTRSGHGIDAEKAWRINSRDGLVISQESINVPETLKHLMENSPKQTVTLYANWTANKGYYQFHANSGMIPNESGLPEGVHKQSGNNSWYFKLKNGIVQRSNYALTGFTVYQKALLYELSGTLNLVNVEIFGIKKSGYHLKKGREWNTASNGTGIAFDQNADTKETLEAMKTAMDLSSKDSMELTLYAQWEANGYIVRYSGNGAESGSMPDQSAVYNKAVVLAKNKFERTGYVFTGWNTAVDGTGTTYQGHQSVKNLTDKQNGIVTLYAQWKPISYTIRFDGNGAAAGSLADIKVFYDQAVKLSANLYTRETEQGKSIFMGWNRRPDTFEQEFEDEEIIKNLTIENGALVILYAIWDDCPMINACDRYFTLKAAKEGRITEEELLLTASGTDKEDTALEKRTAAQIEEAGTKGSISLYGYDAQDFTKMEDSGSVRMNYRAVDRSGNTVYEIVTIYITSGEPMEQTEFLYTRFLNEKYYNAEETKGGLHRESVWRKDTDYRESLKQALQNMRENRPEQTYIFSRKEVERMNKDSGRHAYHPES